jgi:hypothetical protein
MDVCNCGSADPQQASDLGLYSHVVFGSITRRVAFLPLEVRDSKRYVGMNNVQTFVSAPVRTTHRLDAFEVPLEDIDVLWQAFIVSLRASPSQANLWAFVVLVFAVVWDEVAIVAVWV